MRTDTYTKGMRFRAEPIVMEIKQGQTSLHACTFGQSPFIRGK